MKPEYEKCIEVDVADSHPLYGKTWCGKHASMDWYFQGIEHAALNAYNGGHLTVCKECAAQIRHYLEMR